MARQFDKALLDKIRQGQYETEYKGVTVLVKPIPEGAERIVRLTPGCSSPCA